MLDVLGSGLGRTGTKSLHTALNLLGLGPCHHMVEVFQHPESVPLWIEAGAGRPNWDAIFSGYRSAVDYPSAAYWRELAAYYPAAKVIHTVRDPDRWFDSTQATIFAPDGIAMRAVQDASHPMAPFFKSIIADFGDRIHDRGFMTRYFLRHTEAVKATISAERLLIYEAGEGWPRLCAFLGVPIPDAPFPSENSTAEFRARAAGAH